MDTEPFEASLKDLQRSTNLWLEEQGRLWDQRRESIVAMNSKLAAMEHELEHLLDEQDQRLAVLKRIAALDGGMGGMIARAYLEIEEATS